MNIFMYGSTSPIFECELSVLFSKLRLLDEKSTNKRKKRYTHLNGKRYVRRPTVGPTDDGLYIGRQSLDEIERLSNAFHDSIDILAAVKYKT